jgi:hypothetical protein
MNERIFRLFVSSPGDVDAGRLRAEAVCQRLDGEMEGVARIEPIRWETS